MSEHRSMSRTHPSELLVRQLGFTDVQLGLLNAVYSLPNIVLVLVGGILVDRFTARRVAVFTAALCFLGALLTAFGSWYPTMVAGRLLFGIGADTAQAYLALANVACVGGSWMAPRDAVAAQDWPQVERLAAATAKYKRS